MSENKPIKGDILNMGRKIEVQKGPIVAGQKTMITSLRKEIDRQDHENDKKRLDGQTLKMHTPK
jgi:hypothetical protein